MLFNLIKQRGTAPLACRKRLLNVIKAAGELTGLDRDNGFVNVILANTPTIIRLNSDFVKHQGMTDVITFDLRDDDSVRTDIVCVCAAEIYVCPEVALNCAKSYDSTPSRELVLYIVHGMLHLTGEDDLDETALLSMRAAEARVMSALEKRFSLEGFIA